MKLHLSFIVGSLERAHTCFADSRLGNSCHFITAGGASILCASGAALL
jgi:hypothetical protein